LRELPEKGSPDDGAVEAWKRLGSTRLDAESIEVVRKSRDGARVIYRLPGAGLQGAAVIAKRCPIATGWIERTIYQHVLPRLAVTAPHYYGYSEQDDTFGWLFIEDVGQERFSPLCEQQRIAAARWLGLMHTAAARLAATVCLPDRGPNHYLGLLRSARGTILTNLTDPQLDSEGLSTLKKVVCLCDELEAGWQQLEKWCESVPVTLVHGDFRRKNVYIRTTDLAVPSLFPIDWETAGWGVPAADLAPSRRRLNGLHVDLETYWSVIRECWPSIDMSSLQQVVRAGFVFRRLAGIHWASMSLASPGTESAIALLTGYHAEISQIMQPC